MERICDVALTFYAWEFLQDLAYDGKPKTGKDAILLYEAGERMYSAWVHHPQERTTSFIHTQTCKTCADHYSAATNLSQL